MRPLTCSSGLSGIFFADPKNQDLSLTVEGGPAQIRHLAVHEMQSIWNTAAK